LSHNTPKMCQRTAQTNGALEQVRLSEGLFWCWLALAERESTHSRTRAGGTRRSFYSSPAPAAGNEKTRDSAAGRQRTIFSSRLPTNAHPAHPRDHCTAPLIVHVCVELEILMSSHILITQAADGERCFVGVEPPCFEIAPLFSCVLVYVHARLFVIALEISLLI